MNVGENIKKRRLELGLNAERLAEKVGLSAATIYRYEKGAIKKVDSSVLMQIAEALNTSPVALMGYDMPSNTNSDKTTTSEKTITPDIERAAIKATEILLKYNVNYAPVDPLQILQSIPGVVVVTFTEMADESGPDRTDHVTMFGSGSQDAILYRISESNLHYVVAYNQRLPYYMLQMALARELGHIILGHGDSQPGEVYTTEALLFARYLLCPRPLIRALKEANLPLTVELIGNITGCYGRFLAGIRATPGAHIPSEMNRQLKVQFEDYIDMFIEYQRIVPTDKSAKAEFGTYMDNYID